MDYVKKLEFAAAFQECSPKAPKEPTVIEKQAVQEAKVSLENIDKACAGGCNKNSVTVHGY
jgi:hypothetical protein